MTDIKSKINERIGIDTILNLARKKMVPMHRYSIWYYMGAMLLFLFLIQIITGPLLLFYYKPSAQTAYESIAEIMVNVPYGWLIRSVHHWASNLMIAILFTHFFSTLLLKAYRRPRELTWLTGIGMLLIVMFLGYSGYTLPLDERSFFALNVGTDIPSAMPVIGNYIMQFLRGGETIGPQTLNRFFALHVGILPICLMILLAVHILLVQLHGMSVPISVEQDAKKKNQKIPAKPMFPHLIWHDMINCLILLGVLATLSILIPSDLGHEIDYLKPAPAGVKPDWFFLWVYQTLKILPTYVLGIEGETVGIVGLAFISIFVAFIPFLDIKSQRNELSPYFTLAGIACMCVFIICTAIGYFF